MLSHLIKTDGGPNIDLLLSQYIVTKMNGPFLPGALFTVARYKQRVIAYLVIAWRRKVGSQPIVDYLLSDIDCDGRFERRVEGGKSGTLVGVPACALASMSGT